jgi:uncharacterized protein
MSARSCVVYHGLSEWQALLFAANAILQPRGTLQFVIVLNILQMPLLLRQMLHRNYTRSYSQGIHVLMLALRLLSNSAILMTPTREDKSMEQLTTITEGVITDSLIRLQRETGVRILYACEAGSRAWEFASKDSDYDIRFLYVWPKQHYLRIDNPQDTIERMEGDLDLAGWDIYKALRLFRKSNPPLLEWLFSPVIYAEKTPQIARLRDLARASYSSSAVFYHYSRMASRNYRQYIDNKLKTGDKEVPLKKYLYVVRPMVALLYVEQHRQLPPTSFLETLKQVEIDTDIRKAILELVGKKQAGYELGMGQSIPVLNTFADEYLDRWMQDGAESYGSGQDFRELDAIVSAVLDEE